MSHLALAQALLARELDGLQGVSKPEGDASKAEIGEAGEDATPVDSLPRRTRR